MSVSQQVVLHLKGLFSQTGKESLDQRNAAQVNSKQISVYNHLLNTRPPNRYPIVTFVSNENNFKNANGKKLPILVKGPLICNASSGFSRVAKRHAQNTPKNWTYRFSRVLYLLPAPSSPPPPNRVSAGSATG